jgi:hypothetical protein
MSQADASRPMPEPFGRLVLVAVAMSSGAALVVSVLTRVSLGLTLLCAVVCVVALGGQTWQRLTPAMRPIVLERIRAGLLAGVPATVAYDLARLALVEVTGFRFWPFDTFPLFGQAILGTGLAPPLTLAAGIAYHYLNGACFAVGYALLFRRRLFAFGIAWALGLEAAMLIVYPRWLPDLGSVLGELTAVSLTGHLAYGVTMGLIVQLVPSSPRALRWTRRRRE